MAPPGLFLRSATEYIVWIKKCIEKKIVLSNKFENITESIKAMKHLKVLEFETKLLQFLPGQNLAKL